MGRKLVLVPLLLCTLAFPACRTASQGPLTWIDQPLDNEVFPLESLTQKNDVDKLIVQIDPHNLYLEIGLFGWDYDWGTANDPLVMNRAQITDLPDHDWEGFEKEYTTGGYQEAGSTSITFLVKSISGP